MGYILIASMIGIFTSSFWSFTFWNSGDSAIVKRIHRPTRTSTIENRNGRRQPQAKSCASVSSEDTTENTSVPSTSPSGAPSCGQLP